MESNRVHLSRFHLVASLTEHKVRSQAPSPPCTPLPAPTTSPAKRLLQTRFSQSLWLKAAPPVLLAALPTPWAEESKRIHRRHFHLSASLTGHKVRSQAPSPPCTPLPAPTTPPPSGVSKLASLNEYWFPVLGGPLCGAENMRPTQSRKHAEGG